MELKYRGYLIDVIVCEIAKIFLEGREQPVDIFICPQGDGEWTIETAPAVERDYPVTWFDIDPERIYVLTVSDVKPVDEEDVDMMYNSLHDYVEKKISYIEGCYDVGFEGPDY